MPTATKQARRPIARRSSRVMPGVSAMKSGTSPSGSTTTKSVAKAVMRKPVSIMDQPAASSRSCAVSHSASARSSPSITSAYFFCQVSISPRRSGS